MECKLTIIVIIHFTLMFIGACKQFNEWWYGSKITLRMFLVKCKYLKLIRFWSEMNIIQGSSTQQAKRKILKYR